MFALLRLTGIKPESIVSYDHRGNNDGKHLSAPKQLHYKEISKSNVVCSILFGPCVGLSKSVMHEVSALVREYMDCVLGR